MMTLQAAAEGAGVERAFSFEPSKRASSRESGLTRSRASEPVQFTGR
jgi:hypothetical protein